MLLTITTTHQPATDLSFLLHKHPAKVQSFDLSFGQAHVFYPEATEERCTAALLLDINPIQLIRDNDSRNFPLRQYVNDRPYVASSFLSVAIGEVYGTALSGICKLLPDVVQMPLPLTAKLSVVPSRGGAALLHELFAPLGYTLNITQHPLDEQFPVWGDSPYFTLELSHTLRLSELLSHLYVLIPVLDNNKHYFVDDIEIEKLLRRGKGWLPTHPQKDLITTRYLKYRADLRREALARLLAEEEPILDEKQVPPDVEPQVVERQVRLHEQRLGTVLAILKNSGAKRVLDLGCGSGALLRLLLKEKQFTEIVGMDVSYYSLERAADYLRLDQLSSFQRERLKLLHGSVIYRDQRLNGYDAAAVVEVIEHLDLPRLRAFERNLFAFNRPPLVVLTTPNADYNVMWESLPAGEFRHKDHRFEWTRAEFEQWAADVCTRYGYQVRYMPIGAVDETHGAPSQMAIFELETN